MSDINNRDPLPGSGNTSSKARYYENLRARRDYYGGKRAADLLGEASRLEAMAARGGITAHEVAKLLARARRCREMAKSAVGGVQPQPHGKVAEPGPAAQPRGPVYGSS